MQEREHISIRNRPVTTHRYDIRLKNPDHWGVFFWDSEERLVIHSAWGTWSHGWDGEGRQWNAEFLGRVVGRLSDGAPCYGYLVSKLTKGAQEFDEERTQAALKKLYVARPRRERGDDATREAALDDLRSVETPDQAWQWAADHGVDAHGAIKMRDPCAVVAMLEALWDVFVKAVREGTFTVMECPEKFPGAIAAEPFNIDAALGAT